MAKRGKQPAGLARARAERSGQQLEARKVAALERIAAALEQLHERIVIFVQRPAAPIAKKGNTDT